jgi:hypothetical protein
MLAHTLDMLEHLVELRTFEKALKMKFVGVGWLSG